MTKTTQMDRLKIRRTIVMSLTPQRRYPTSCIHMKKEKSIAADGHLEWSDDYVQYDIKLVAKHIQPYESNAQKIPFQYNGPHYATRYEFQAVNTNNNRVTVLGTLWAIRSPYNVPNYYDYAWDDADFDDDIFCHLIDSVDSMFDAPSSHVYTWWGDLHKIGPKICQTLARQQGGKFEVVNKNRESTGYTYYIRALDPN